MNGVRPAIQAPSGNTGSPISGAMYPAAHGQPCTPARL
jgi:hypothetical protein